MLKQRVINGFIFGAGAVLINFSILSLCVHKNWITVENGLCVPEFLKIIHNPVLATITQAAICFVIGFLIGCFCTSSRQLSR